MCRWRGRIKTASLRNLLCQPFDREGTEHRKFFTKLAHVLQLGGLAKRLLFLDAIPHPNGGALGRFAIESDQ
jgi:hypothetical protein